MQKKIIWEFNDILNLTSQDLNEEGVLSQIKGMVLESINTKSFDDCRLVEKNLSSQLRKYDASLKGEVLDSYDELMKLLEIGQARFFQIPKQLGYYTNSILVLLRYGFELGEVFEISFLFSDPVGEDSKTLCRHAFEKNQETLGSVPLEIEGHNNKLPPTIENWLLDYRTILLKKDMDLVGGYSKAYYFTNSKNYGKLNEKEKELLKKILDFYGWLHLPSIALLPLSGVADLDNPLRNHGVDLEAYKQKIARIQPSPVPRPVPPAGGPPVPPPVKPVSLTPTEIKREVDTLELPRPPLSKPQPIPSAPSLRPMSIPMPPRATGASLPRTGNFLADINLVEDLKKITLAHLRQGDLYNQINLIKSKIVYLAQINKLLPYYTVNAFEQSPLFRMYVTVGARVIADNNPNRKQAFEEVVKRMESTGQLSLTLAEFEAMADLRKEIEKL